MAKNYMQDVARMLGVELEEEFKFRDYNNLDYYGKITDKGVYIRSEVKKDWRYDGTVLQEILTGLCKIEKLPWQPKRGEEYYFPATGFQYSCPAAGFQYSCSAAWYNSPIDFALKEAGMIFKTKAECEAALPELRKKYLGGDDNV